MKKAGLVLLALAAATALGWLVVRRIEEQRDPPRRDRRRTVPVETAAVDRADLADEGTFRGTLAARSHFVVAPKVAGRLETLAVDLGDEVRHGDLVATLDSEEFVQQVAQAQAELDVGRASLQEAESAKSVAVSDAKRVRDLHGEGVASDARLEEAEARLRTSKAQVALRKAQVRQREAALRTAETRLAYTRLHAAWPDDQGDLWLVAERFASEGSMLRANEPVVSLVHVGGLHAVVHAIERDFPRVVPGQPARLRTDAYPGEWFEGRVARRAPVIEERSRHARVEVEVDNPDGRLAPGMFVRVHVQYDERPEARVVPHAAMTRRDGRDGVFHLNPESMTVHFVAVETGLLSDGLIELRAPDLEGEVVVLGHHLLEDGSEVTRADSDGAAAVSGQGGGGGRR